MVCLFFVFFFKQKTAYEMRISDWSSDVCSSDLQPGKAFRRDGQPALAQPVADRVPVGVAEVEADADPAVAEIGRAVITIGVHLDQRRLLVGAADLDQQRDLAVAVVIVGEIGEFLALEDRKSTRLNSSH